MNLPQTLRTLFSFIALSAWPIVSHGQDFASVQTQSTAKLETAIEALGQLQESIAEQKIPMAQKLNGLEIEIANLRAELKRVERLRDNRDLNLSALEAEVKARRDELDYSKNLLVEFISNQNSGSDAAERQLYEADWLEWLNAADAPTNTDAEAVASIQALLDGVELGITRLDTALGGAQFAGEAVLSNGDFKSGKFLLFGPISYFSTTDGSDAGITQQGPSGEPTLIRLSDNLSALSTSILSGEGDFPLDATLGKALAMETNKETLLEHIEKGGIWIYPILFIAAVALIIALIKFIELRKIRTIPKETLVAVITALQAQDTTQARSEIKNLSGTAHDLLAAGIENFGHGRDLIEQSLEEVLMRSQPKLERLLSVIWITASTAPLLGLLGTVTGIIHTFKLLTIYGSGDPKSLGAGISEALITTEFGLVVAIPALILHALLQRKAKRLEDEFESDAMTLLNGALRAEKR